MNDIFERTWGERAGPRPDGRLLADVIPAVRARHPEFVLHRRGLLGSRVGAPAAGLRLLLRQAALRPPRARRRRGRAGAPDAPTSATSGGSSASSRTTTSRARRRRSRREQAPRGRRGDADARPGRGSSTRGSPRGARSSCRCSSAAAPTSSPTSTLRAFYDALLAALARPRLPRRRRGSCASAGLGRQRDVASTSSAWGWRGGDPLARGREPRRRAGVGDVSLPWHDLRGRSVAARRRRRAARPTSGAATTSAPGCTSRSTLVLAPLRPTHSTPRRTDDAEPGTPAPPSTADSPRRPGAPRTTCSRRTRGTSGGRI